MNVHRCIVAARRVSRDSLRICQFGREESHTSSLGSLLKMKKNGVRTNLDEIAISQLVTRLRRLYSTVTIQGVVLGYLPTVWCI